MSATSRYLSGWTLAELCVTLAVIAIMVTVAIPAWYHHMQHKQLQSAQHTIINAINYTRMLAISEQMQLALCSPHDNWAIGFRVVLNKPDLDCAHSHSLRQWQLKYANKLSVHWHGFNKNQRLSFFSHPNQWGVNGTFTLTIGHQKPIHMVVNRLGQVSTDAD